MMVFAQGLTSAGVPANVNTVSSAPRAPFSFASPAQSTGDQAVFEDSTVAAGTQQNAPDVLTRDSGGLSAGTRLLTNPRLSLAPSTSRFAAPSKFALVLSVSVQAAACSVGNAPSMMPEAPTTPGASGSVNKKDPEAGATDAAQQGASSSAPLPRSTGVSVLMGPSVAQRIGGTTVPGAPVGTSAEEFMPIVPVTAGDVPLPPKVEVSFAQPMPPQALPISRPAEPQPTPEAGTQQPATVDEGWIAGRSAAPGLDIDAGQSGGASPMPRNAPDPTQTGAPADAPGVIAGVQQSVVPDPTTVDEGRIVGTTAAPGLATDAGQTAGASPMPRNAPDPTQGVVPAVAPAVIDCAQRSVVRGPTVVPAIDAAPEGAQNPASGASPAPAEELHAALPAANSAQMPSWQKAALPADLPAMMNVHSAVRLGILPTDLPPTPQNAAAKSGSFRPADPATNAPADPAGSVAQKDALQPSAVAPLPASSLLLGARAGASTASPEASGVAREGGGSGSGAQQESSGSREQKPAAVGGISAARSSPFNQDTGNASLRAAGEPGWAGAFRSELHDPSAAASHLQSTAATEQMCSTTMQGNSGSSLLSTGEAAPGAPPPTAPAAATAAQNPSAAVPTPPVRASDTNEQPSPAVGVKADAAGSESWKSGEVSTRPDTTELRVSFQTDGLGPVELRASLHQNSVAASIAVSRGDVQAALSGDLTAVHQAMAQHDLRLESLKVIHSPLGNHGGLSAGSHSPRGNPNRDLASPHRRTLSDSPAGESVQPAASWAESSGTAGLHGRLSIHV